MFECKLCDYYTDRSYDLEKHNKTKKHIKTEYLNSLKNNKDIKSTSNKNDNCQPDIQNSNEKFNENIKIINNTPQFNYIIHEREFIKCNENVFKIGKTSQHIKDRFSQYPKGSKLLIERIVNNCNLMEHEIIKSFDKNFINRPDIGREYYEGNYNDMEKEFLNVVEKFNNAHINPNTNKNDIFENDTFHACTCGKYFIYIQGLYKHKKICKEIIYLQTIDEHVKTIKEKNNVIEMLTKQIESLQQQTQPSCQQIEKKPTKKQSKLTNTTNNANIDNRTINIVTYINDNFPNTKPISMLTNVGARKLLKFDESCGHTLEEMIVFQHSKYLLDQFIGDFIVNEYKKKNPEKQQIWSSNVQKLTFIVRQVLNKTDHAWLKDFNGICVIKHVIYPILQEVKKILQLYSKQCAKIIEDPSTSNEKFEKLNNTGQHILKIIYEINQKTLHENIARKHIKIHSSTFSIARKKRGY